MMKHATLIAALLLGPALIAQAPAQQPAPAEPPLVQRSIKITAEQGHTIKQIVKDTHPTASSGDEVKIGDKAPAGKTLNEFPALAIEKVPAVKGHKFFVHNDKVVIVSGDNTIADIL